ncbi:hypothetical protein DPMN_002221 [Dreissena polymorpha]|uniref:Uncharacterized protein n=1 Tax=Dreissena polymorpha TaxID=45954 RepID=A0A9D4MKV7_DREPO|nr:hypothetical protein DPMN_002221 [Dreissena polymorpha]
MYNCGRWSLLAGGRYSQVFSSQFTRRSSDLGVVKTEIQNILKRKREILDKFEGNFNSESKNLERESDYASENEYATGSTVLHKLREWALAPIAAAMKHC